MERRKARKVQQAIKLLGLLTIIFGFITKERKYCYDTSINNVHLNEYNTTIKYIGDLGTKEKNGNTDFDGIYFKSVDSNQYLRVIHYPGYNKNSISKFEVSYLDSLNFEFIYPTTYKTFTTENGVHLNQTYEEFIKSKHKPTKVTVKENDSFIILYSVKNQKSSFLLKYNSVGYNAQYYFTKDSLLYKFVFGLVPN